MIRVTWWTAQGQNPDSESLTTPSPQQTPIIINTFALDRVSCDEKGKQHEESGGKSLAEEVDGEQQQEEEDTEEVKWNEPQQRISQGLDNPFQFILFLVFDKRFHEKKNEPQQISLKKFNNSYSLTKSNQIIILLRWGSC